MTAKKMTLDTMNMEVVTNPDFESESTKIKTACQACLCRPRCAVKRSLHRVSFYCVAPDAQCVRLVGDFNGWDMAATPMRRMPDGRWFASLELCHGHHQYYYLVDGKLQLDPNANGIARDDQNQPVSLLAVS
jgi:1,4-alpha-glucan branching enzyme